MQRLFATIALLCACGGDDGGPSGGSATVAPTTSTSEMSATGSTTASDVDCSDVDIPGCEEVVEVCEAGDCSCLCADPSTSTQTPDTTTTGASETSSSSSGSGDETPTSGVTETTGGMSPLGECISVDMWESCAQYCEADSQSCLDAGCDGATVFYYGTGGECGDLSNGQASDQSCDAPLESSGGVSFARCCCG